MPSGGRCGRPVLDRQPDSGAGGRDEGNKKSRRGQLRTPRSPGSAAACKCVLRTEYGRTSLPTLHPTLHPARQALHGRTPAPAGARWLANARSSPLLACGRRSDRFSSPPAGSAHSAAWTQSRPECGTLAGAGALGLGCRTRAHPKQLASLRRAPGSRYSYVPPHCAASRPRQTAPPWIYATERPACRAAR